MEKLDIRSLNKIQLENFVLGIGEKKFRSMQIYEWLNKKLVCSFDEMTNISIDFRRKLDEKCYISPINIADRLQSKSDEVTKYLFELEKGTIIESVFMKYSFGNTVCLSSQAGCRMGCGFCASTIDGLERNLSAGEMCSQVYEIQKDMNQRISNIVVMGSGEPFDNYDNLLQFIEIINSKEGLEIGQRHITVSTCGMIEKMVAFADLQLQVNLAVSLHAPNDELRVKIMPIAKKYKMDDLLNACKYYTDKTNRRITYEYALISGVNDSVACAKELGQKLKHTLCHVNLIPMNEVKERDLIQSKADDQKKFFDVLDGFGIETTVRRKLGIDINAACGQLRRGYKK